MGDHAAVGRLTLDELEDRSGRALTAKTRGELATLTNDLPREVGQPDAQSPAISRRKPVRWMVAIMGGSQRRGRFRTVGRINAIAIMGGDEIDLREAEIEGGELTLNLVAVMGGQVLSPLDFDDFRHHHPCYSAVAIDEGQHLVLDHGTLQFGNHSRDPNLWMGDEVTILARRDIDIGEELTIDYALQRS